MSADRADGPEPRGVYYVGVPGVFAREVKATIYARLGLPLGGKSIPTPMMDASLFAFHPRRRISDNIVYHVNNVLPPRKHADQLMDIYWRYLQPVEPFLEQERFTQSYEALFAGCSINCDERIFISSLNAIFALSTQAQERMEPREREEASDTYFHRAWALLNPETILWESGSLEIIQCLLLMGRYLQCTNNTHQTWMAIGSAVRIAQSFGLHVIENSSAQSTRQERQSKLRLWQCCVFMERFANTLSCHRTPFDLYFLQGNFMGPWSSFNGVLDCFIHYDRLASYDRPEYAKFGVAFQQFPEDLGTI